MIRNKYIVDNSLIRGSQPNFIDIIRLKKENINQVLCISDKSRRIEEFACKLNKIKFIKFKNSLTNGQYLSLDDYNKITNLIKNNSGKTFMHCKNGLHRTAECVGAYQILGNKKSFQSTLNDDIFDKQYFGYKYKPANTVIKTGDNLITRLIKKHNTKIYKALTKSMNNFINIFKPTQI